MKHRFALLAMLSTLALHAADAQGAHATYARADTLRGSYTTPQRIWWDVTFYDLHVAVSPADSSIRGYNGITYRVLMPAKEMQIDLMVPLEVDSMVQDGKAVSYRREGNAFFASPSAPQRAGASKTIAVYYHGKPQPAKRPPWDGGFSWKTDSLGAQWIVTTDQGMGASVWWPNKDTQADEPDSMRVAITVPEPLADVGNGRLRTIRHNGDGTATYEWFATNPINNYAIALAIGEYDHWSELYHGEWGTLTMDFWPLAYHVDAAKRQWVQARPMLQCFEHWFGPYPWYEDGYKLIEVSNNGMEHQSAVAYGNGFANGYRGRESSGTGLGMKWDFIIVHESAHEWFGNNITTKDLADMWVHESFANYAEGLYTECLFGKQAGADYIVGNRRGIRNDRPIIGAAYGVNAQGSGDMYPKGGEMLHTIRQIVNDDEKWRGILRGLNKTFWHQTVMGSQIQDYISKGAGTDLSKVFEQYLTTTKIPVLEYAVSDGVAKFRWANAVPGFNMPLKVRLAGDGYDWVHPTEQWQTARFSLPSAADFKIDVNFYVEGKNVGTSPAP
ncbi:MAG TPA: M1 family metallopeptidase [Gemmatimonadaceae bacterium]